MSYAFNALLKQMALPGPRVGPRSFQIKRAQKKKDDEKKREEDRKDRALDLQEARLTGRPPKSLSRRAPGPPASLPTKPSPGAVRAPGIGYTPTQRPGIAPIPPGQGAVMKGAYGDTAMGRVLPPQQDPAGWSEPVRPEEISYEPLSVGEPVNRPRGDVAGPAPLRLTPDPIIQVPKPEPKPDKLTGKSPETPWGKQGFKSREEMEEAARVKKAKDKAAVEEVDRVERQKGLFRAIAERNPEMSSDEIMDMVESADEKGYTAKDLEKQWAKEDEPPKRWTTDDITFKAGDLLDQPPDEVRAHMEELKVVADTHPDPTTRINARALYNKVKKEL